MPLMPLSGSRPVSSISVDRAFRVDGWSASAEAMFGWAAAEALGRDVFELLGDSTACVEPVRSWLPCRFLASKRHKDGRAVHVHVAFEPIDHGVRPSGVLVMQPVEVPVVAPLAESEARYQSVVAAMVEGVVVQDRDGRILASNAAAERILGLTTDQMQGRTSVDPRWRAIREDGSPFPGQEHPAMVTLRTGQACSRVVMGVHKPDGELTWISINSQPIRLAPDQPPHAVVATFVDITRERELAGALERDRLRMREAIERNEALVAELRLALDSVRTLAGLLPVCAWCKSVRDDQGYWQKLEVYLAEHTDAQLTHGLCPTCSEKVAPKGLSGPTA